MFNQHADESAIKFTIGNFSYNFYQMQNFRRASQNIRNRQQALIGSQVPPHLQQDYNLLQSVQVPAKVDPPLQFGKDEPIIGIPRQVLLYYRDLCQKHKYMYPKTATWDGVLRTAVQKWNYLPQKVRRMYTLIKIFQQKAKDEDPVSDDQCDYSTHYYSPRQIIEKKIGWLMRIQKIRRQGRYPPKLEVLHQDQTSVDQNDDADDDYPRQRQTETNPKRGEEEEEHPKQTLAFMRRKAALAKKFQRTLDKKDNMMKKMMKKRKPARPQQYKPCLSFSAGKKKFKCLENQKYYSRYMMDKQLLEDQRLDQCTAKFMCQNKSGICHFKYDIQEKKCIKVTHRKRYNHFEEMVKQL